MAVYIVFDVETPNRANDRIALNHHQADSDAHACAEILLRYMESGVDVREYVKKFKLSL
jgi:hypothetical protein